MAKRNYFAAFVATMVMVVVSSCTKESSFLGMEYEVSTKTPTTTSKVSTKFENSEIISAKFDTTANKLFTVEQVVEVEQPEQPTEPAQPEKPEKPIDRILPENWGSIIGAGISAVPADQVNGQYAQKCITIRTDKGAVAVVFSMENAAPEVSSVLNGYFVKGNFGAEYNSGYFTTTANRGTYSVGKWAPAIAKDLTDRIAYYKDNTCVRNVRNTSLTIWNWRGGNLSTVVDGYDFSVDSNNVLTVTYNGEVVLQLR